MKSKTKNILGWIFVVFGISGIFNISTDGFFIAEVTAIALFFIISHLFFKSAKKEEKHKV